MLNGIAESYIWLTLHQKIVTCQFKPVKPVNQRYVIQNVGNFETGSQVLEKPPAITTTTTTTGHVTRHGVGGHRHPMETLLMKRVHLVNNCHTTKTPRTTSTSNDDVESTATHNLPLRRHRLTGLPMDLSIQSDQKMHKIEVKAHDFLSNQ